MSNSRSVCPTLMLAFIIASIGCGGGAAGSAPPIGFPGSVARSAATLGRSWMSLDARTTDLLYVSDNIANEVYVYAYPGRKRLGTLTGLQAPNGECVDNAGDVFIANSEAHNVREYRHGDPRLFAILSDANDFPIDCSVDPTTGNLAVTNVGFFGSQEGSVAIYKNATGSPTFYTDPDIYDYRYCGFDNRGNLFVDGDVQGPAFRFAELPKDSSTFTNISLNQSIRYPAGVLWDGTHVVVGDAGDGSQDVPTIYQFGIKGRHGMKVGSTRLDASDSVFQFWIQPGTVIAPDSGGTQDVRFYRYPAGGSAKRALSGSLSPAGSTISEVKEQ